MAAKNIWINFGVRRQSEVATALFVDPAIWALEIQSGVALALATAVHKSRA
jgi:hypothetical protein